MFTHRPIVSVIMSVLNGEEFVDEAVRSILCQTFKEFEFIIVNDGSSDQTGAILDKYATEDRRIRVIHQHNQGLVKSLNLACRSARGKYLARMDADDVAFKTRLRTQRDYLEAHPSVSVLGSAVEFIDASGRMLMVVSSPCHDYEIKQLLLDGNVLWHPSVMLRMDTFLVVGGYRNIPRAEDYDLWLRIADQHALASLSDVLLRYRIHDSQVSVTGITQQAFGALACRAAARQRLNGDPDMLEGISEITVGLLNRMGVSTAEQQTGVARGYLVTGRNLSRTGRLSLALTALQTLHSDDYTLAEPWVRADAYLCTAKIRWMQKEYLKSLWCLGLAFAVRPAILGRPFKQLGPRLLTASAQRMPFDEKVSA